MVLLRGFHPLWVILEHNPHNKHCNTVITEIQIMSTLELNHRTKRLPQSWSICSLEEERGFDRSAVKTVINTIHRKSKGSMVLAKEAGCPQSAVSKQINRKLSGRKRGWYKKVLQQQPREECQTKCITRSGLRH